MKRYLLSFATLIQILCVRADAIPAQVLIIRHAEKPVDNSNTHLSDRGFLRAQALVKIFGGSNNRFDRPDFIIAQNPDKADGSVRAIETAAPLAAALSLSVDNSFVVGEGKRLAKQILSVPKFDGKTVLIIWGHDDIPKIALHLGSFDLPGNWKAGIFDRVWRLSFENGTVKNSENLPMLALPGDSDQ